MFTNRSARDGLLREVLFRRRGSRLVDPHSASVRGGRVRLPGGPASGGQLRPVRGHGDDCSHRCAQRARRQLNARIDGNSLLHYENFPYLTKRLSPIQSLDPSLGFQLNLLIFKPTLLFLVSWLL